MCSVERIAVVGTPTMSSSAWRIAFSRSSVAIRLSGSVNPGGTTRWCGRASISAAVSRAARPEHRRVPWRDQPATVVPHEPAPSTVTCMGTTYAIARDASDPVVSAGRQRRRRVEAGHLDGDGGGLLADVVAAGLRLAAGQRLVEVLGGQHAEHDGPAGVEADAHDPGRGLAGDVLEVRRLAADDAAEADHGVVVGGQGLGGERDLERARHPRHGDVVVGDAGRRPARGGRRRAGAA